LRLHAHSYSPLMILAWQETISPRNARRKRCQFFPGRGSVQETVGGNSPPSAAKR
jgi:hypothetical protein